MRTSPIFSAERYFLPTLRFREPLGILPSCFPLPIENDREVGRKVRNVKAHSPKLVGVKERAGSWRTNIKFNQIAEEEHEKDQEMAVFNLAHLFDQETGTSNEISELFCEEGPDIHQAEVPEIEESFCVGDTMVCNLSHLFNENLPTLFGMGAGADTHQGEGTPETRPGIHPEGPDEADLGELSDNPSIEEDSPLPVQGAVSRTNQRELFEKYPHLCPGIMIKAPMCVLLTIACMVLANRLMVRPCYCLPENEEATRLWTAFLC